MSKAYLHPSQRSLKTDQIGPSSHRNEYHVATLEGNWQEERHSFGPQPHKAAAFAATTTQRVAFVAPSTAQLVAARPPEAYSSEVPRALLFGHGGGSAPVRSQVTTHELSFPPPSAVAAVEAAAAATSSAASDTASAARVSVGGPSGAARRSERLLRAEGVSPRRERSDSKRREAGLPPSEAEVAPACAPFVAAAAALGATSASSAAGGAEAAAAAPMTLEPLGVRLTRERFTTTKNAGIDATAQYVRENPAVFPPAHALTRHGPFVASLNAAMHKTALRR